MGDIVKKVLILGLIGLFLGCSSGKQTIHAIYVEPKTSPQTNPVFESAKSAYENQRYQLADSLFTDLLLVDESNWQTPYYLGLINLKKEQFLQSENHLFKALDLVDQLKENRALVYFTLGRLYECQQNLASAKLSYLTAYRLNPNSLPIQQAAEKYQLISSTK